MITDKKPKFSIGDKVRVSLLRNTFEKGYTSNNDKICKTE